MFVKIVLIFVVMSQKKVFKEEKIEVLLVCQGVKMVYFLFSLFQKVQFIYSVILSPKRLTFR